MLVCLHDCCYTTQQSPFVVTEMVQFPCLLFYVHCLVLCGRTLLIPALDRLSTWLPFISLLCCSLPWWFSKTQKWTCGSPGWIPSVTPAAYRVKCGLFNGTQNIFQVHLLLFLPHFPPSKISSYFSLSMCGKVSWLLTHPSRQPENYFRH